MNLRDIIETERSNRLWIALALLVLAGQCGAVAWEHGRGAESPADEGGYD